MAGLSFLLALLPALQEPPPAAPPDPAAASRIRDLEERIALGSALTRLALTRDQLLLARRLAESAAAERGAFDGEMLRIREEQAEAFADFRREDEANQGFSPEVERRTARADHREKELRKGFFDRINRLEEEFAAALTDGQREVLGEMKRRPPGLRGALRRGPPPPDPSGPDEAGRLRSQLDEIHREKYGAIGPVGRMLIHPAATVVLDRRIADSAEPTRQENHP